MTDSSGHTITLSMGEYDVEVEFTCHEGDGAKCHQSCDRPQCEEGCTCKDAGREPIMKDWGECLILTWINNSDCNWIEHYEGPEVSPRSGSVVFTWNGDDWTWKYAEDV